MVALAMSTMLTSVTLAADKAGSEPLRIVAEADTPRTVSCYGDAGLGLAMTISNVSAKNEPVFPEDITTIDEIQVSPDGFVGVLGAGCDLRASGLVLGAWGNYIIGDLGSDFTIDGQSVGVDVSNQYNIGLRAGFYATESLMLFARVGYAQAEYEVRTAIDKASKDINGWLIGVGGEQKLYDGMHLRLSIDYTRWDKSAIEGAQIEGYQLLGMTSLVYKF